MNTVSIIDDDVDFAVSGNDGLEDIPVVMATSANAKLGFGLTLDDLRIQYGKAPEAFVEKPVDELELLHSVKRYLPL